MQKHRFLSIYSGLLLGLLFSSASSTLLAKEYLIDDKQDYKKIAASLKAGDTVILKNGVWQDFEIDLKGEGSEDKPITLRAQTPGKVILSGQSNLQLSGQYLVASGLVFKDGFTPSRSVVEFRTGRDAYAYHSRVTEVVIDNFNNPDKEESDFWVSMYGQHNRFDHSHLVGKRNKGVTVAVRLNSENSQQNYHSIDHNYFGYRPIFGSNGGETLRVGTSHYSLTDSHTTIENNYFDRTNGEVEVISVKSGKNILRGNVFFEARGALTMRHGNDNLVENNVFFGNGKPHTGGIRVINKNHIIQNNYLEGLTGYFFGSGFTVLNGVPNSPINRYHQVDNAHIKRNTFIDVEHMQLAAGSDAERSAVPINSSFTSNIVYNSDGKQPFTAFDDVSGIKFEDNVSNTDILTDIAKGFNKQSISMKRQANGLLSPSPAIKNDGSDATLKVITKDDVGVSWYPKKAPVVAFGSGKETKVKANASALIDAIAAANDGDTLLLNAGSYDIPKLVYINKTLSIKAIEKHKAIVNFDRSALFEIHDGGSLHLDGLVINGGNSPDSSGNSVIRAKKWGMLHNYRFVMSNSVVENLDINHSFHFFSTGKGAFADEITLIDNTFSDVTGDIIRVNSEIEDLGIYNVEYITLEGNSFTNVAGGLLKAYRGGTDESTFGPQLVMVNNSLENVGRGKRNKEDASLYLHGVQVTNIRDNNFIDSALLKVEHTVGEPKTVISNNTFTNTAAPTVVELRAKGPHTATLENNTIEAL